MPHVSEEANFSLVYTGAWSAATFSTMPGTNRRCAARRGASGASPISRCGYGMRMYMKPSQCASYCMDYSRWCACFAIIALVVNVDGRIYAGKTTNCIFYTDIGIWNGAKSCWYFVFTFGACGKGVFSPFKIKKFLENSRLPCDSRAKRNGSREKNFENFHLRSVKVKSSSLARQNQLISGLKYTISVLQDWIRNVN